MKSYFNSILKRYRNQAFWVVVLCSGIWYYWCLPFPLFQVPYSTVVFDRNGQLLSGRIAEDGQWRFPISDTLPQKFIAAITTFEDKRFFDHPGIDPISLVRAIIQNVRHFDIISGGSTLSMQVIRLSRHNPPRNLWQKMMEAVLATRLEIRYTKAEILALYAAHAPFGGNVVGLETASWRYFGKKPALLTWAEASVLAVLPNQPGLIHPGRNRAALLAKRNRLLTRLFEKGFVDEITWELAMEEALPEEVVPLPDVAPHLVNRAIKESKSRAARLSTTIDLALQQKVNRLISQNHQILRQNDIHNIAAIIVDVSQKEVLTYIGNVIEAGADHGAQVDVITAPRSTGSILKPFLYAAMLDAGEIFPTTLVSDIPTVLNGYRPENFYRRYDGLISARQALIRSLNVPFVNMLQTHGLAQFHYRLQALGLSHIDQSPSHYGLPLILGGAESSLWDLVQAYTGMAKTLTTFHERSGRYWSADFTQPMRWNLPNEQEEEAIELKQYPQFSAGAIWHTFEAMRQLERPNEEGEWRQFSSSQTIAWKTGTSIGFRDAWAIGLNPEFVVGIWVGNADGEGRPGLVGVQAAAPILFQVFDLLPSTDWFLAPYDELEEKVMCSVSGYPSGPHCPSKKSWVLATTPKMGACPFHRKVFLDDTKQWRVHKGCEEQTNLNGVVRLALPPLEGFYYQKNHPHYVPVPPYRNDCQTELIDEQTVLDIIYPTPNAEIFIPKDLGGNASKTVFSLAHQDPEVTVHWHIDHDYVGATQSFHELALQPTPGKHVLVVVDEYGNRKERSFEIIK